MDASRREQVKGKIKALSEHIAYLLSQVENPEGQSADFRQQLERAYIDQLILEKVLTGKLPLDTKQENHLKDSVLDFERIYERCQRLLVKSRAELAEFERAKQLLT